MFYLPKQQICEVESCLTAHSLPKAACFQLRHFSSTEMSRGWRRTGGPSVISVTSLISMEYIRYEHMKMRLFHLKHPMFWHGFHWLIRWSSEADQLCYMQHMRLLGTSRKQWENSLLGRWSIPNFTRNWRSYVLRQHQVPWQHCRCKTGMVLGHSLPVWMYSGWTRMCCRKYMKVHGQNDPVSLSQYHLRRGT